MISYIQKNEAMWVSKGTYPLLHSWCLGQCCCRPSRSFVRLVGDEVDRASVTLALITNGIQPGSRPSLVGGKTRQRARG